MARPIEGAVILGLVALLTLSACGRKGALESPNTAKPGAETNEDVMSNPEIDRVLGKP